MAVSGIGSPVATLTPPAASGGASKTNSVAAAQQEATESLATTRKEAGSGDKVAIRKLKQEEAAREAQQSAPSEAGKGRQVDKKA